MHAVHREETDPLFGGAVSEEELQEGERDWLIELLLLFRHLYRIGGRLPVVNNSPSGWEKVLADLGKRISSHYLLTGSNVCSIISALHISEDSIPRIKITTNFGLGTPNKYLGVRP